MKPTAPAVKIGPSKASPTTNNAITAIKPTNTATAIGPAAANAIAALIRDVNPRAISATPMPKAINAAALAKIDGTLAAAEVPTAV